MNMSMSQFVSDSLHRTYQMLADHLSMQSVDTDCDLIMNAMIQMLSLIEDVDTLIILLDDDGETYDD